MPVEMRFVSVFILWMDVRNSVMSVKQATRILSPKTDDSENRFLSVNGSFCPFFILNQPLCILRCPLLQEYGRVWSILARSSSLSGERGQNGKSSSPPPGRKINPHPHRINLKRAMKMSPYRSNPQQGWWSIESIDSCPNSCSNWNVWKTTKYFSLLSTSSIVHALNVICFSRVGLCSTRVTGP